MRARLSFGERGEVVYGRRHFLDLVSVFTSPPLFTVLHGRNELGTVHEIAFLRHRGEEPTVLSLGARSWTVTSLDWGKRLAYAVPSEEKGKSQWLSTQFGLSSVVCRAMHDLLSDTRVSPRWSSRAKEKIASLRSDYEFLDLLRQVPLFANFKDEDKVCIEETEEWRLPAGELLVKAGEPAEHFFVLLEGEISVCKKHGYQEIVIARYRSGAFFGEVPLLLGVPYILTARAESDSRLIVFAEEGFWRLLRLCPAISSEIFRAMATRLRNLEGSAQQQQKLEALGTMSAGLAHELNNPSSAAKRIAVQLGEVIQTIQSVAHRLHHTLEHEHWDRLIALVGEVLKNPSTGRQYHSIEQSDSEDVLAAWLREGGVTDAWKIAPTLVGAGSRPAGALLQSVRSARSLPSLPSRACVPLILARHERLRLDAPSRSKSPRLSMRCLNSSCSNDCARRRSGL